VSGRTFSKDVSHGFSHLGGVVNDGNTVSFESSDLRLGISLSSRDDSTSVTHSSAGRGSLSSNERHNGEVSVVMGREPFSGLLFGFSTDFSNHDNSFGLWIVNEALEDIDEVGSVEGITSNSDNSGLSEVLGRCLVDGLVSQSTGAGNDSDLSDLMDVAGHNSDLASVTVSGLNDSGTVRANKSSLGLRTHNRFHSDHIESGDTFSNADNKGDLSLNSFEDSSSSEWRGNVDDGSFGSSLSHAFSDIGEDGETKMS